VPRKVLFWASALAIVLLTLLECSASANDGDPMTLVVDDGDPMSLVVSGPPSYLIFRLDSLLDSQRTVIKLITLNQFLSGFQIFLERIKERRRGRGREGGRGRGRGRGKGRGEGSLSEARQSLLSNLQTRFPI
jgi:hypothetical protein